MKKTKFPAMVLALIMIFGLTACVNENKQTDHTNSSENQSVNENTNSAGNESSDNNSAQDIKNEISFTELLVVDNDECAIRIAGIDEDNFWGYTLSVQLENKSAEKTYMYSVESASINGVQSDPFFAAEVAAGKKSNNEIHFSDSTLAENGVGDYTDIELTFRVYDSNDWLADEVARETVHVYPYGKDKATSFVRESQTTDNIIVDNDYVTVIVTGYEEDMLWGYAVNLFMINKTDKDVMFSVDEASINGYMADPFYAVEVLAGKCAFSSMNWFDSTLEDNNITAVEEIEFKLRVYDSNNWLAEDFANEFIILKP